jgi:hypothetical protein
MSRPFTRTRRPIDADGPPPHPHVPWASRAEHSIVDDLAQLAPEWRALHHIALGTLGSSIEHLAIGPGGIFLVKHRNHPRARVRVLDHVLMVDDMPAPHLDHARFEAQRAGRLLSAAGGARLLVTPVLALTARRVHVVSAPRHVHVVSPRRLGHFLASQPTTIDHDTVRWIESIAASADTWRDDT